MSEQIVLHRCPWVSTDETFTKRPRADGWRCGLEVDHKNGHILYSEDGEHILSTVGFRLPDPIRTLIDDLDAAGVSWFAAEEPPFPQAILNLLARAQIALTPKPEYGWVWASTPDYRPFLLDEDFEERAATLRQVRRTAPVIVFQRTAGTAPGPWKETTL